MAHVQPGCCLFIPQGLGEHEVKQGGRWMLDEMLTKALSWNQDWEKREEGGAGGSRFDFCCAGSPLASWSDVLLAVFQCISAWGFF